MHIIKMVKVVCNLHRSSPLKLMMDNLEASIYQQEINASVECLGKHVSSLKHDRNWQNDLPVWDSFPYMERSLHTYY